MPRFALLNLKHVCQVTRQRVMEPQHQACTSLTAHFKAVSSYLNLSVLLLCCFQLRQSQLELREVQLSHRQLSTRLEELTDEHSLQSLTPHPSSLLCEIEQSMEQEEQEQEREQVKGN